MKLSAYTPLTILFRFAWWVELARQDVRSALQSGGCWHRWFLQRARHAAATARRLLDLWRVASFA